MVDNVFRQRFNAGVFPAPSTAEYRLAITVPAASVTANLTGYPVYIDLSGMPSAFWAHCAYKDGRDIRVKNSLFADIPFDLVLFQPESKTGGMFVRTDLSSTSATTFYIHYGNAANGAVPVTAANGRNAVWAGFHRVFTFGNDAADRTGNGADMVNTSVVFGFAETASSPATSSHQGVAWDGTYYYTVDTNYLRKWDASWTLVASNSNPAASVAGANHCGDPEALGGFLYVPLENFNGTTGSVLTIAKYKLSDLSFVSAAALTYASGVPTMTELSGCAYNPADGLMYLVSWADGSKIWKYDLGLAMVVGTLSLAGSLTQLQGITFWKGALYANSDSGDATYRFNLDGTGALRVWGVTAAYEGISHTDDALLVLIDATTQTVRRIEPRTPTLGAQLTGSGNYRCDGMSRFTTWTMGITAQAQATGASRSVLSYSPAGSFTNSQRATLAYRNTNLWGLWNSTDSWINNASAPGTTTAYRLHGTHDGTTVRQLFVDGTLQATDSGIAERPSTGSDFSLYIGAENSNYAERFNGFIGFAYLYPGILSNAWIAAESSNLKTPGSFYTVGSEAPFP